MTRIPELHLPELLAPAGSPESLRAAVAAGADAVYLSGKRFGARKFAANFSDAEITEGIRLAHSRGVRVYVTVNTLIHDRELAGVAEYLLWLYAAGADAVLVQDTGVAAMARDLVPALPIHASTQMTLHNTEGVLWAADQGFSRVVLSRELSLAEIHRIAEKTRHTGTGLEVFIHGALCYSYSGQCLLSSVIGGRSGNRGMCAQPCRKPYSLVTADRDVYGRPVQVRDLPSPGRYLLSPKDLCTYRHLPELVNSPVVSLKIEGRMKSPQYVAIVVSTYRRALDAIARGEWKADPGAERDLLLAFNRGFTAGYLFGEKHASLMARDAPDNRGIVIGVVTKQDAVTGAVMIRQSGSILPATGDGLLFRDPAGKGEDWGFLLNNAPVMRDGGNFSLLVPRSVSPGMQVSITSSRDLEMRARQILSHPLPELVHKIPVDLKITVSADGQLIFEGSVSAGPGKVVPVIYRPGFRLVEARSRPTSREQLEAQVRKSGETPFVIRHLSLAYQGDLFAPVAELNRMRREFLTQAEETLVASFLPGAGAVEHARQRLQARIPALKVPSCSPDENGSLSSLRLTVYTDSPETVSSAVKEGCDRICFEPPFNSPADHCHTPAVREDLASQVPAVMARCRDAGVEFILKFPRITRDDYLDAVLPAIPGLCRAGLSACMAENPGAARALNACEPGLAIAGAAGLNVFNHQSACRLAPVFRSLTLSPELSGNECRDLVRLARSGGCRIPFSVIVQGTGEAMITEDCLLEPLQRCRHQAGDTGTAFFGIRDTTGHLFPVRADGECRTRIGNAVETCLLDHLPALARAGISDVVIDARGRTGAYAGEMTRIYRSAIAEVSAGTGNPDRKLAELKEQAKIFALGGITAGPFVRGLKE
jgi:putative protease